MSLTAKRSVFPAVGQSHADQADGVLQPRLRQIQSISCATADILCLSLDWSNRRTPTTYAPFASAPRCILTLLPSDLGDMIVSLSNGSLSLLRPQEGAGLAVTDTWHAHDYEPWIAAWNYWDPNVVFSGERP